MLSDLHIHYGSKNIHNINSYILLKKVPTKLNEYNYNLKFQILYFIKNCFPNLWSEKSPYL